MDNRKQERSFHSYSRLHPPLSMYMGSPSEVPGSGGWCFTFMDSPVLGSKINRMVQSYLFGFGWFQST